MSTTEPAHEPEKVPVQVAWSRCMRDIEAVGKNRMNQQQNYRFRAIDDFIDAASPVFSHHGVIVLPNVLDHRLYHFDRLTSNNKPSTATVATVRTEWTIVGPMGDTMRMTTVGEGADTADKATNKAMSAAYKYAISQGLTVPVALDDGDASNGANDGDGGTAPRQQRAQRTTSSARKATGTKKAGATSARKDRPAADAPAPAPEELPVAQQRLLDRIHGLPAEHQQAVAAFCKAEGISLRRPTDSEAVGRVTMFIDGMPD